MIFFHAHKNSKPQSGFSVGTEGLYNLVTWPASGLKYNVGGRFANNAWTPVLVGEAPGVVTFTGRMWVHNATSTLPAVWRNYVARIVKNGDINTGETILAECASVDLFTDVANITISAQDIANPGDTYRMYLFVTNPNASIDAHPLGHTLWQGSLASVA